MCLGWGWRKDTGGPGPRSCVESKKIAERQIDSERQEGICVQREFAVNGIKSSKIDRRTE